MGQAEADIASITPAVIEEDRVAQQKAANDAYQGQQVQAQHDAEDLAEAQKDASKKSKELQQKMYDLGKATTAINLVFGGLAAVIREATLASAQNIAMRRGELSQALTIRMQTAKGAGVLRAVPFIGNALGGLAQAAHDTQQQGYGTEFIAKAAAVFESSIPKIDAALDNLAVSIKSAAIGIKYAFAPAEGAYQQKLLDINTGPAATAMATFRGQREIAVDLENKRREEFDVAKASMENWPSGPGGGAADRWARESLALERLKQAQALADQFRTEGMMDNTMALRKGLEQQRALAGQAYMLDYYKGFSPTSGANYGSFGWAGDPGGLPAVDRAMTEVELTAAIKALTQALEGINPTGRNGA